MAKMNQNEFGQEPVVVEDFYPAELKETTEYQKDYGDGPVDKVAWVFKITASADALDPDVEPDEEFTGELDVAAHTSLATGPKSNFAKLGLPVLAGEDWDGDTDSLIGSTCEVYVESYETKGGQFRNVISKIRIPKGKKAAKGKGKAAEKARKDEKAEAEDFDGIDV